MTTEVPEAAASVPLAAADLSDVGPEVAATPRASVSEIEFDLDGVALSLSVVEAGGVAGDVNSPSMLKSCVLSMKEESLSLFILAAEAAVDDVFALADSSMLM
jgi:hypothetical protein